MNSLESSMQLWAAEPSKALVRPHASAVWSDEAAQITTGPFTLRCDLPLSLGGRNAAVSPVALLLSALTGCAVALIKDTIAPQLGIRVGAVSADAICSADFRGLVGMAGASGAISDLELLVSIESPDGVDKAETVYQAWLERCPVYLALIGSVKVSTRLIATAGVD